MTLGSTDRAFDQLVPVELRPLSPKHWTPIGAAIRAAALLSSNLRVLDVGSGVGKLCAVGALSSTATWCGVEQHEVLVLAARRLARSLGIADRTMFVHGDAFAIDWSDFDALYLYNPFQLPVFSDTASEAERALAYRAQVARVEERLAGLRIGTRVLTLHGFGGVMPASFELVYQERLPGVDRDLVLWIQRSRRRGEELTS